ncbi:MAG: hypothetical protein HYX72_02625 [Acidobacteria bacterium]|nr:hypothetical protein [Acidobacteriota bacterium]
MQLRRSRITSLLLEHGLRWLQQFGKTLRQLWLECTGALFIGMGALAVPAIWKEWRQYEQGTGSVWRILVVVLFILTTFSFGVYSFLKARRIR